MKAFCTALIIVAVSACSDQPTSPPSILSGEGLRFGKYTGPVDPTATWKIPLADAALSLRSDHLYTDGSSSAYADGVCNVSAKIFATAQLSNSGDATMQTSGPQSRKCQRTLTLVYPDGFTESVSSFNNLNQLQNTSYSIPVGATVTRRLVLAPSAVGSNSSRCGKLHFGQNANGLGVGSDSILVTRVDASTWKVQSQSPPNDRAVCDATGQIFEMQVSFAVVSSYTLP